MQTSDVKFFTNCRIQTNDVKCQYWQDTSEGCKISTVVGYKRGTWNFSSSGIQTREMRFQQWRDTNEGYEISTVAE